MVLYINEKVNALIIVHTVGILMFTLGVAHTSVYIFRASFAFGKHYPTIAQKGISHLNVYETVTHSHARQWMHNFDELQEEEIYWGKRQFLIYYSGHAHSGTCLFIFEFPEGDDLHCDNISRYT